MVLSKKRPTKTASKKSQFKKLGDYPAHKEATERLAELKQQEQDLHRTVDEFLLNVWAYYEIKTQAAELVSGVTAVAIAKPDVRAELKGARQRLAITTEAIGMQKQAVDELSRACHEAMADERKPEHIASVERINSAITDLEAAINEERAIRKRLIDDGGSPHGLPIIPTPGNFGFLKIGQSWTMFREWRLRMARINYIIFSGRP